MSNVEAIAARGHEYIDRMYRDKDVKPRTYGAPAPEARAERDAAIQERNAAMVEDRRGGLAISEIAVKYGVSVGHVSTVTRVSCKVKKRLAYNSPALKARNAAMVKDYKRGMLPSEIAAKYGVTVGAVSMLRKREGIPAQHRQPCGAERNARVIADYLSSGDTMRVVGKRHGVSADTVGAIIRRARETRGKGKAR